MRRGGLKLWWTEQRTRLVQLYGQFADREARLERARARIGTDAFLSGHDGWFFHRGLRDEPDQRD